MEGQIAPRALTNSSLHGTAMLRVPRVTDHGIQGVRLKTEPKRMAHLTALLS